MGSDDDLRAAVAARRELGADYEAEIIDGFMAKVDARIAERVGQLAPPSGPLSPRNSDPGGLALAIVSVIAAFPITGVAGYTGGLPAIFIVWGGLVAINLSRVVGRFMSR